MIAIGIAGGSGSGKSTVVNNILEAFPENTISVKPMHQQFIEPTRYYADLIIPKGGKNKICIDIINSMLKYNLRT